METADRFREDVGLALNGGTQCIAIDLQNTRFIDSSGCGALVKLRELVDSSSMRLLLVNPRSSVLHMLKLTGLSSFFEIAERTAAV